MSACKKLKQNIYIKDFFKDFVEHAHSIEFVLYLRTIRLIVIALRRTSSQLLRFVSEFAAEIIDPNYFPSLQIASSQLESN